MGALSTVVMLSFRSAPTTFHMKCGGRCQACRYNLMRHVGKGGLVSSFSAQREDVVDEANTARAKAFTRACRNKKFAKLERMLSSGSFEIQQQHVDIVQEDVTLRELLLRSAAEMKRISVSCPRCPQLKSIPSFLVDYILESERAFIIQRSGRFTDAGHGSTPTGKFNNLSEENMLKLFSYFEGREMHVWPALSRAFAFGLCDTSEFAKLHDQNTFSICYNSSCG